MRPMTAREAVTIDRTRYLHGVIGTPADYDQARRILDALVELREASLAYVEWTRAARRVDTHHAWTEVDARKNALHAAEHKLAALERGEEPEE